MATKQQISNMIAAIKSIYPYYGRDTDVRLTAELWERLLTQYPDGVVSIAFYRALQKCKVPPTPADVVSEIDAIINLSDLTDAELWEQLSNTKRALWTAVDTLFYPYSGEAARAQSMDRCTEAFNALHDVNKQYVASVRGLINFVWNTEEEFEKGRYMRALPTIKSRVKVDAETPAEIKVMAAELAGKLRLPE